MNASDWDNYVSALKLLKAEKPKNLAEKTSLFWEEIHNRQYIWDRGTKTDVTCQPTSH